MAEVTRDMIYKLALEVRGLLTEFDVAISKTLEEARALNHEILAGRRAVRDRFPQFFLEDAGLDRIDRQLDLVEPATP
jgi:hypothetical protein